MGKLVDKKQLGDAIRGLREQAGLSPAELAERLHVSRTNVVRYESGEQAPEFKRLSDVAAVFDIGLSDLFRLAEQGGVEPGPDIRGTVPIISWVQAGAWQDAIDNLSPGEGSRVATTYRPRRHTYALRVRGDSMEPKFPDGAILIVEPDANPEPGAYVIVRQNGDEATFKQLMQDGNARYLKPLNPRYPIMELKPDAVFCGVVKRVEMDV